MSTTKPITVIKVGGSLLGWSEFPRRLRDYLDSLNSRTLVLIVGGGGAADFVRILDQAHGIGEKVAHSLALRSLDLTAHAVAAMVPGLRVVERPEECCSCWEQGQLPLLAPRWFVETIDARSHKPLEASWSVTSDSIAARFAAFLEATELHLLKSTGLGGVTHRDEASRTGVVDLAFAEISKPIPKIRLVNLRADPPTIEPMQ